MFGKITGRGKSKSVFSKSSTPDATGDVYTPNVSIAAKVQLTDKTSERYFIHQLAVSADTDLLISLKQCIQTKSKSWSKSFITLGGTHSLSVLLLSSFNNHYSKYSLTNMIKEQQQLQQQQQLVNMSDHEQSKRASLDLRRLSCEDDFQLILNCVECIKVLVEQCGYQNLFVTRDFLTSLAAILMATPFTSPISQSTTTSTGVHEIHRSLAKAQIEVFELFHATLSDFSLTKEHALSALESITSASMLYHEALRFSHIITSLRRAVHVNRRYFEDQFASSADRKLVDSYLTSIVKFLDGYVALSQLHPSINVNVAQELVNLGFIDVVKLLKLQNDHLSPMIKEHLHSILHSDAFTKNQREQIGKREYIAQMIDQIYYRLEDSESYGYLVGVIQHLISISNTANAEFVLNNWRNIERIVSGCIVATDEEEAIWDTSKLAKVDDRYLHLQDRVLTLQEMVQELQKSPRTFSIPQIITSSPVGTENLQIPTLVLPEPIPEETTNTFTLDSSHSDKNESQHDDEDEEDEESESTDDELVQQQLQQLQQQQNSEDESRIASTVKSLRLLHFEEISNVAETIFSGMLDSSDIIINQEELLGMFSGQQRPITSKNQKKSFIDPKRAKQISYELETIKLDNDEIRRCILEMDEIKLSERNVTLLAKIVPTVEEADIFTSYKGNPKDLAPVDLFFYTLRDISDLKERMDMWMFKLRYKDTLVTLWPDLESLIKACMELRTSQKWFELLKVILSVANFLNRSADHHTIQGFKLTSLLRLKEIRSVNNQKTMIQYLCGMIHDKYPHLSKFDEELMTVSLAAKINDLNAIHAKRMNIKRGMNKIEMQLQSYNAVADNDKFIPVMTEFLEMIRLDFNVKVEKRMETLMQEFEIVAKLYNEDPELLKEKPGQFFKNIQQFITQFKDPTLDLELSVQQREMNEDDEEDGWQNTLITPRNRGGKADGNFNLATIRKKGRARALFNATLNAKQSNPSSPASPKTDSEADKKEMDIFCDTDLFMNEQESLEKQERLCSDLGLKKAFIVPTRRFVFEGKLYSLHSEVKKLLEYQAYLFTDCLVLQLLTQIKQPSEGNVDAVTIVSLEDMHIKNTPNTTFYLNAFCIQNFKGDKTVVLIDKNYKNKERWVQVLKKVLEPAFFSKKWQQKITEEMAQCMEEEEDGAINSYYVHDLQVLRDNFSSIVDEPDSDDNIQYIPNTTDITFASLHKLLFKLTDYQEADNNYLYSFMLTYKAFISTEDLLLYLFKRYNTPPPQPPTQSSQEEDFHSFKRNHLLPMRLRIAQILMYWINEHFYNFRDTIPLQTKLRHFITEEMAKTRMTHAADRLLHVMNSKGRQRDTFTVQQMQKQQLQLDILQKQIMSSTSMDDRGDLTDRVNELGGDTSDTRPATTTRSRTRSTFGKLGALIGKLQISEAPTSSMLDVNSIEKSFRSELLSFPALEIARNMTAVEFSMFERIQPKECLNQSWNSANQRTKAPNLYGMISRTNLIVAWVAYEVVQDETPKGRAKVITKFIKIAHELRNLHNFNSLKGIIGGLNCNAVHRLKKSWTIVKQKHKDTFSSLSTLVGQQQNYKAMRDCMEKANCCIPYIGMYLTDLTFIEDGNKDKKDGSDNLINFFKQRQLSCVIRNIQLHQKRPYNINTNTFLTERLASLSVTTDENELYETSLKREPRT